MSQLQALALTLAVEVPVALALVLALRWVQGGRALRAAGVVATGSLLTHPFAWWASLHGLRALPFETRAGLIEAGVVAVETTIVAWGVPLSPARAFAVAALANAASFTVGLLVV